MRIAIQIRMTVKIITVITMLNMGKKVNKIRRTLLISVPFMCDCIVVGC